MKEVGAKNMRQALFQRVGLLKPQERAFVVYIGPSLKIGMCDWWFDDGSVDGQRLSGRILHVDKFSRERMSSLFRSFTVHASN